MHPDFIIPRRPRPRKLILRPRRLYLLPLHRPLVRNMILWYRIRGTHPQRRRLSWTNRGLPRFNRRSHRKRMHDGRLHPSKVQHEPTLDLHVVLPPLITDPRKPIVRRPSHKIPYAEIQPKMIRQPKLQPSTIVELENVTVTDAYPQPIGRCRLRLIGRPKQPYPYPSTKIRPDLRFIVIPNQIPIEIKLLNPCPQQRPRKLG